MLQSNSVCSQSFSVRLSWWHFLTHNRKDFFIQRSGATGSVSHYRCVEVFVFLATLKHLLFFCKFSDIIYNFLNFSVHLPYVSVNCVSNLLVQSYSKVRIYSFINICIELLWYNHWFAVDVSSVSASPFITCFVLSFSGSLGFNSSFSPIAVILAVLIFVLKIVFCTFVFFNNFSWRSLSPGTSESSIDYTGSTSILGADLLWLSCSLTAWCVVTVDISEVGMIWLMIWNILIFLS